MDFSQQLEFANMPPSRPRPRAMGWGQLQLPGFEDPEPAPVVPVEAPNQTRPMFMRARDIPSTYQPWPGDKQQHENWGESSSGTGETMRTTGGSTMYTQAGSEWGSYAGGRQTKKRYQPGDERPESDDELWDRKYDEGAGESGEYSYGGHPSGAKPLFGSRTSQRGSSMDPRRETYDSAQGDYVTKTNPNYRSHTPAEYADTHHEYLRNFGIEEPIPVGEQYLLGGHHRVAWAARDRPNLEVPLEHLGHDNIQQAKYDMARLHGRYT